MTRHPDRARENRVRRLARSNGLVLEKSRRRDPAAAGYGLYALAWYDDRWDPPVVIYPFGLDDDEEHGATLAEAERWLRSGAWTRERARVAEPARETSVIVAGGSRESSRFVPRVVPGAVPGVSRAVPGVSRAEGSRQPGVPRSVPGVPEECPEGWPPLSPVVLPGHG